MARGQWVNIVYGIWDHAIRRVIIFDDDVGTVTVALDEQLVRMPLGKYQNLPGTLEQELML